MAGGKVGRSVSLPISSLSLPGKAEEVLRAEAGAASSLEARMSQGITLGGGIS